MGLLQSDEQVKSIVKSERANYRRAKYEYNKKRHFMKNSALGTDTTIEEKVSTGIIVWVPLFLESIDTIFDKIFLKM